MSPFFVSRETIKCIDLNRKAAYTKYHSTLMKRKDKIDFSTIWKQIHIKTSDKEVEEWKATSEKNKKFYNDAERYYTKGSVFRNDNINSDKYLHVLYRKLKKREFMRYAGKIAAVLVLAVSVYLFVDKQTPSESEQAQQISPGTDMAVLILNNGSEIDLSSARKSTIHEKDIEIQNSGKSLVYNTNAKTRKKHIIKPKPMYNTLRVPRGGQYFLILADSTKVWLNADSELSYPVRFTKDVREVALKGEGYFEVKHDESRPFYVKTDKQRIRVLGTSFNISAYSDDKFTKTTLVNGSVQIERENQVVVLKPSEQAVLDRENGNLIASEVVVDNYIAWKDGNYFFDMERLDNIILTLSRWYDFDFEFENESAKEMLFTGSFSRDQDLKNIILIIEQTKRIKIAAYGKKLVIK